MSARKEGDQREFVPGLDGWSTVVERQIRQAQAQGDFDNLAGAGQPLNLGHDPSAGEWSLAHHLLRNAGVNPAWVDLQQEVEAQSETVRAHLTRASRELTQSRDQLARLPASARAAAADRLRAEIARARLRSLRAAAVLDRLIVRYNAAIPRQLSWLEKPRLPGEEAAARFDRLCPPLPTSANGPSLMRGSYQRQGIAPLAWRLLVSGSIMACPPYLWDHTVI